jgi:arylsulfatase A-like enzyme
MNLRPLRSVLLAACAIVSAPAWAQKPLPSQPSQPARPINVVFVLVDDLRYDAMGFLKPGLRTPNIDFLARNGVYFPNAVVTSSLCSPSRATILTGQSTRNHRVVDNNNSTEQGLTFFPQYLQQSGYQTGFFGKWHMGDQTDAPRPGFDRWVSFLGQGTYNPTDNLPAAEVAAGKRQMLNVDGQHVARKGYITDELTDYAMDWLEHGRDKSKPFFLYLSHKAVHSDDRPAIPAERYRQAYSDLDIQLPASMANTPENSRGKPMWVQNQRNSWHGVDFPYHSDQSVKELERGVYRALSSVDDSLGRLLAYLRANHLEQNTMIVFTSDNGFMYGDHGLIDKRTAYEPSVRVPLVVYAPGLLPKGKVNKAVLRNLDFAPTFLDVAHVPVPRQMEGESWIPVATGRMPAEQWNQRDFVYEYYWEWSFPMTPTTFAIERNRVKFIQYHGIWDTEELYDLEKDPDEMHNLIDDPAYLQTKIDLRHRLFTALANSDGRHVVPYTERFSAGIHYRNENGPHAADFPAEWYTAPNRPDKINELFPDSPAKLEANRKNERYVPKR